jgi:hypothetical protein
MFFTRPRPDQVRVGLAALKYMAQRGRPQLVPAERDMLAAVQRVFGTDIDVEQVVPLGPEEVAARVADPQLRWQIVCALIVFALVDGEPSESEAEVIAGFAAALGVEEKAVANLRQAARRENLALRIDVIRRFWVIDKLRERVANDWTAPFRFARAMAGRYEDRRLAERFGRLRDLPAGTLGREYVRYLDDRGWPLPGERGAQSDIIVDHDMTHVLSGYGTDPASEVEFACFSAGYRRKEPFTFILFVLLQFHAGVRMTPGAAAERGMFDIERALAALERGAAMNVDLTEGWNYWEVIDVQVDALRVRYGIPPRRAA